MSISFMIDLVDKLSGPAKAAQSSVTSLADNLKKATTDLASYQKQLSLAKSLGDVEGYKKYSAAVSDGKRSVFDLRSALEGVQGPAQQASGGMGAMAEGASGLIAEINPIGLILTAIALEAAACAAALVLVFKGGQMALQAVEAKQKLTTLFDALGEGKISGTQTIAMLDELGSQTGQTREQLAPLAKTFMAMGITGVDQLKKITLAAASAGALAEGGGEAFTAMFKKINAAQQTGAALKIPLKGLGSLASMGLNVDDVSKQMGISSANLAAQLKKGTVDATKFGDAMQKALIEKGKGPLEQLAGTMDQMKAKFSENILKMFEDVKIDGFIDGLKSVGALFDQSTSSGRAMKMFMTKAFDTVFAVAAKVFPYVRAIILGIVIAALKIYIALKPAINAISELFSGAGGDGSTIIDVLSAIGGAAAWLITAFTSAAIKIKAAFQWMSNEADILHDDLIGNILGMVDTIMGLPAAATTATTGFIDGLVGGITSGAGLVIDAIKSLGTSALAAITGVLKVHSPSQVMHKIGGFTAEGFAGGIDAKAPMAAAAMTDMGTPPDLGGGGKGGGGGGAGGGTNTYNIEINIQGADGASELTEQSISLMFERIALTQGLAT